MSAPPFLTPEVREDEEEVERSLRPRRLDEFVGQRRIKEQLAIALDAAKGRGEALDHVLLVGPPGLGKTSLAYILREELGVGIRSVAGPALERKDVAAILTAVEARDVVFVDEIHRLGRALPHDDVEPEVLERRVENLFRRAAEPVDLVDEDDVARLDRGEDRGDVLPLERGPRDRADPDAELLAEDMRKARLAEPRRADQEHVVERLASPLRSV